MFQFCYLALSNIYKVRITLKFKDFSKLFKFLSLVTSKSLMKSIFLSNFSKKNGFKFKEKMIKTINKNFK